MQTYPLRRSRFQRHRPGEGDCKMPREVACIDDIGVSAPSPRGRGLQDFGWSTEAFPCPEVSAPSPRGRGLQGLVYSVTATENASFSAIAPGKGTARRDVVSALREQRTVSAP